MSVQDPDDTLKRKTLDLLYKMTKSSNVEVIVERMIGYIRTLNDAHNKTEIAGRIIELAERFAPSNQWFMQVLVVCTACIRYHFIFHEISRRMLEAPSGQRPTIEPDQGSGAH